MKKFSVVLSLTLNIFLHGFSQKKVEQIKCISIPPLEYYDSEYIGNPQKLIDDLKRKNYPIDSSYLDKLDRGLTDPEEEIEKIKKKLSKLRNTNNIEIIPVKFWVYRDNIGSGGAQQNDLNTYINTLNTRYSTASVRFYFIPNISYINNSSLYRNLNVNTSSLNTLFSNNRMIGTLNIHVVETILNNEAVGVARFPEDNPNFSLVIASRFPGLSINEVANVVAHETGHTLGLLHTHHPGMATDRTFNGECKKCYQESVSRTQNQPWFCRRNGERSSDVNGDFLRDTEADPILSGMVTATSNCTYAYVTNTNFINKDEYGSFWTPAGNNIMSYSIPNCLTAFTPLQIAKIKTNTPTLDLKINGFSTVVANQQINYNMLNLASGVSYTWSISNGSIISGQGTNSVNVSFTYGTNRTIQCTIFNRSAYETFQKTINATGNSNQAILPVDNFKEVFIKADINKEENDLLVFPNPSSEGYINLKLKLVDKYSVLVLNNEYGNVLQKIEFEGKEAKIKLENFKNERILIKVVNSKGEVITKRIIKR